MTTCAPPAPPLRRTLVDVQTTVDDVPLSTAPPGHSDGVFTSPPTILLLNPTSLAKPHALSMLHADMIAQDVQVAVISETWFKARHSAPLTNIPGYTTFRLDRSRRRGGGVAVYIDAGVRAEVCSALGHKDYEVLWVKTQIGTSPLFICALYHPPTPIYGTNDLLEYLEATLVNMFKITDSPTIILAGDMNKLPVDRLVALGLISVVNKPTHCGSCLDRNPNPNPNPNPRGGKKRPKHMVLVPQDRLEEGLICQGTEASEVKGGPEHTPHATARRRAAWRRSLSASEISPHQQGEAYRSRATSVARQTVERERMGSPEVLRTLRACKDWEAWARVLATWGAKERWMSSSTPRRRRVVTGTMSLVRGGRTSPRVHRKETTSSDVFETLRVWLLSADQAATLASSAAMEEVLEAGTTRVASSAYLQNELPGVTAPRSHVLMINMGGPRAEPWTTLENNNNNNDNLI